MSIADDLDRLAAQHTAGRLTDAEFEAAKARLFAQAPSGASGDLGGDLNSLRRTVGDRWVGGVCGGIAKLTGVESWIIRLLFAITVVFAGFGLIPYVLLWIFVPSEDAKP
jgi:phage shock protein C